MANIRQLDKRRKSVRNIRKITRTMELIATARFKKAMERAVAATDYTKRITQIVQDLANSGTDVSHPLLQSRENVKNIDLLVLTANRGLCGGYNGNVIKVAVARRAEIINQIYGGEVSVSGKRGIGAFKYANIPVEKTYTEFEDQPSFDAVGRIADELITRFITGKVDRVDVAYTKFISSSRQTAVVETLLPFAGLEVSSADEGNVGGKSVQDDYEFLPNAEGILEEVVPASFRARLFKCFLDAAVSEQIARMIAMKGATENAGDLIKSLSRTYNRARQSKITGEIMEIIGGVEALG